MERMKSIENITTHAAFTFAYRGYFVTVSNIAQRKCGHFAITVGGFDERFASTEEAIIFVDAQGVTI